jgi:hypothetical protein
MPVPSGQEKTISQSGGIVMITTIKTPSAKKALRLMDQDYSYEQAVKKVSAEDKIDENQLKKDLENWC